MLAAAWRFVQSANCKQYLAAGTIDPFPAPTQSMPLKPWRAFSPRKDLIVKFPFAVPGFLVALAFSFFASAAMADADSIKKELTKKFPTVQVDRVTKTTYGGLYEVFAGNEIFYTDDNVTFLVLGNIVDTQTKANITEARLQKLTAIKFDDLPLNQAIKLVRGNGSRKIAVFEDPNCGYCKKFEQDLNSLENVTAYIFPYPILSPDSMEKSKSIWCSTDKLKAWQDLMLRSKAPTAAGTCENPIEKVLAFGQKLRVTGTPTTFFEDGERLAGAIPKDALETKIAAATVTIAKK
jgi:thiol:disulfide interchange protein DsbC